MTEPQDPPIYNPNTPAGPNASIGLDQENFLDNFSTLYIAFSENHIALDAASNAGVHSIVQLLEQSGLTQTNYDELTIFSNDVPGQTSQLFMGYPGNSYFQITNYQIYSIPPVTDGAVQQTFYFTFLPGNIIVYFGTLTATLGYSATPLSLLPPVCKNVVGLNIGANTVFASPPPVNMPPNVYLVPPVGTSGIIKTIEVYAAGYNTGSPQYKQGTYSYIVVGNI